jgi:hypothetical protein
VIGQRPFSRKVIGGRLSALAQSPEASYYCVTILERAFQPRLYCFIFRADSLRDHFINYLTPPLAEKVDTSAERTDTQKAFAIAMPSIFDYCKEFAIAIQKIPATIESAKLYGFRILNPNVS